MDPRPDLQKIVDLVETSFELSEISNTPVMMELRIRACHLSGRFRPRDNKRARYSQRDLIEIRFSTRTASACLPRPTCRRS